MKDQFINKKLFLAWPFHSTHLRPASLLLLFTQDSFVQSLSLFSLTLSLFLTLVLQCHNTSAHSLSLPSFTFVFESKWCDVENEGEYSIPIHFLKITPFIRKFLLHLIHFHSLNFKELYKKNIYYQNWYGTKGLNIYFHSFYFVILHSFLIHFYSYFNGHRWELFVLHSYFNFSKNVRFAKNWSVCH